MTPDEIEGISTCYKATAHLLKTCRQEQALLGATEKSQRVIAQLLVALARTKDVLDRHNAVVDRPDPLDHYPRAVRLDG